VYKKSQQSQKNEGKSGKISNFNTFSTLTELFHIVFVDSTFTESLGFYKGFRTSMEKVLKK
jgi:hypothetical protein